MLNQVR
jgi:hypothetical protein